MARILIIRSPDPVLEGKAIELAAGAATLGREAGSALTVADPALSRRHARLAATGDGWCIEDLGSGNGTWVNGERITRNLLRHGDRVLAGATELVFEDAEKTALLPPIDAAPAPETTLLQPLPIPPPVPVEPSAAMQASWTSPPPLPPPLGRKGLPVWAAMALVASGILVVAGGGWFGYRLLATGSTPAPSAPSAEESAARVEPDGSDDASSADGGSGSLGDPAPASGSVDETAQRPAADPDPDPPPVQDRPGWWKERRQGDPAPTAAPPAGLSAPESASPPSSSIPPPAAPAAPPPESAVVFSRTYECRKAAEFHVDPESAMVTVEGKAIGKSDDWDGTFGGKAYAFPGAGTYAVKLSSPGYRTEWIRVIVRPEATSKTVEIELDLAEKP